MTRLIVSLIIGSSLCQRKLPNKNRFSSMFHLPVVWVLWSFNSYLSFSWSWVEACGVRFPGLNPAVSTLMWYLDYEWYFRDSCVWDITWTLGDCYSLLRTQRVSEIRKMDNLITLTIIRMLLAWRNIKMQGTLIGGGRSVFLWRW